MMEWDAMSILTSLLSFRKYSGTEIASLSLHDMNLESDGKS